MSEGSELCPACLDEENRAFDVIREYLNKHPNAGLYQIAKDTGIDESTIVSLIRRGRLRSVERFVKHKCARCGAEVLIVDGDFCERCRQELTSKMRRAVSELSWKSELQPTDSSQERQDLRPTSDSGRAGMFIRDMQRKREDKN